MWLLGSKKGPCKYLPPADNTSKWNEFRDHALAKVRDIEDLVTVGEKLSTCPYYGSRNTAKSARVSSLIIEIYIYTEKTNYFIISLSYYLINIYYTQAQENHLVYP